MLLIMGLSFTLDMWNRVVPEFSRDHRVIVFDNRGVGRSDAPRGRYRIRTMADDAIAVLDAAGVSEPVVLLGASMGGMIAQELALQYPERVKALILGCTACGPLLRAAWPRLGRSPGVRWFSLTGAERERSLIRFLYADGTCPARIEEDIAIRAVNQPPLRCVLRQLSGILVWSSYRRLPSLNVPTLVVHGNQDHVLPPANGRMVAKRIPNAEFVLIRDAGHMITTDQPEASLGALRRFLAGLETADYAALRAPRAVNQR